MIARDMKVHESTSPDGQLLPVFLVLDEGGLGITAEEATLPLPEGALAAVMARFGAPLEPDEAPKLVDVDRLDLGEGRTLRHVRHLAQWDVIARDYLVYDAHDGSEPSCALATTVTGALQHLARAARANE